MNDGHGLQQQLTLKFCDNNSPLFPVTKGGVVEIMTNNFPMGGNSFGGSCPSIRGDWWEGVIVPQG